MHDGFECFAGIDWATESHQLCLMSSAGVILGERSFAHSGAGLADLCDWLVATGGVPSAAIAVAIEVPHGAVVDSLLDRGFAVFSVNPKQLDRFRDRFTVAGAKDDSRDALVLGDSLRTDRHCFRRLFPLWSQHEVVGGALDYARLYPVGAGELADFLHLEDAILRPGDDLDHQPDTDGECGAGPGRRCVCRRHHQP